MTDPAGVVVFDQHLHLGDDRQRIIRLAHEREMQIDVPEVDDDTAADLIVDDARHHRSDA